MTEKRYTIKPQDDLFGVVDNYSADKVCVVNGIRTEIEAKWLCNEMNDLNDENEELKKDLEYYKTERMALLEYIDKKDNLKIELKCNNSGKQSGQND